VRLLCDSGSELPYREGAMTKNLHSKAQDT